VVLSRDEAARIFAALPPDEPPLLRLLYGAGLRIMEGLRLRIKDLDFDRRVIVAWHWVFPAPALWPRRSRGPASPRRSPRTRCAIRSRPICWSPASTSAAYRSCLVIPTSRPR
jgi:integrase